MRIWPYNGLRWTADEQVSASFPDTSGTNSTITEGWNTWLAWAENPNQESGFGCTRPSAPPPTALHAPLCPSCGDVGALFSFRSRTSSKVAQQLQKAVSTVKNLETNDDVDQPGSPKKRKAEDDLDVAVEIVTVKKAREGESDESQEAPTKAEEGNKPTEEAAATDAESAEKPEAVVEAAEKAGATDAETAVKPEAVVEAAEEAGSADGKSVSAAEAEEEPDTATGGVEAEVAEPVEESSPEVPVDTVSG